MEKVILFESNEAVTVETKKLYRSSKGNYYLQEKDARENSCTHTRCSTCGEMIEKRYCSDLCGDCKYKKEQAAYAALEKIEWDEKTPVYDDDRDEWYHGLEDLQEAVIDCDGCTKPHNDVDCECCMKNLDYSKLRLFLGEPHYLKLMDEDYWSNDLAEDDALPEEVLKGIEALNAVIKRQPVSTWTVGRQAVRVVVSREAGDEKVY